MARGLRGYLWLFPAPGGRLNVGAMHSATTSQKLSGAAIEALLREGLAAYGVELPDGARGWPAWRHQAGGRVGAPHLLCVGDAAGIDALTGEGIAVGLEHGPIAAQAIATALQTGDFRFADYGAAIDRAVVGRELALDGRLAKLLYAPRAAKLWLSLIMFDHRVQQLSAARGSLARRCSPIAARPPRRAPAPRGHRARSPSANAAGLSGFVRRGPSGRGAGRGPGGGGLGSAARAAVGDRTGRGRRRGRRRRYGGRRGVQPPGAVRRLAGVDALFQLLADFEKAQPLQLDAAARTPVRGFRPS